VIVLVEDRLQQQFFLRYLRRAGIEQHAMRFVSYPAGAGSGEQWVREQFASEVLALSGQTRAPRDDAQADGIRPDAEQIARLVPKRNIETWVLCLNNAEVDEETDYKRTRNDWPNLIRPGIETLYSWTRPNAQLPTGCVPSLRLGVAELRRLDFRGV
jgi:hypothetical protein